MSGTDASKSIMPPGYTFASKGLMVSEAAWEKALELLEQSDNRCPDLHDMYIYNRFHAYGCLDLIDSQLSAIKAKFTKKEYEDAWIQIEALTIYLDREGTFMMADTERVEATLLAYAVLFVNICKKHPNFDLEHIPDLRHALRVATTFGDAINKQCGHISSYTALLRRFGRVALGPTDRELEAAMLADWKAGLDKETRDEIEAAEKRAAEDEEDEDEDEDPDAWMVQRKGEHKVKENAREFALAGAWREYQDVLRNSPTLPLRGPPEWDLTKWTKSQRKPFEYDTIKAEMEDS